MAIEDALSEYPGRGLIYSTDLAGAAWWVYFITGRSPASKARQVRSDPDGLVIAPIDESTDSDNLRHYACARSAHDTLVVGNGDHIDVLADGIRAGQSSDDLASRIEPEPDPPIWTPRIALVMGKDPHFLAVHGSEDEIVRRIEAIPRARGSAAMLTTYSGSTEELAGHAPFTKHDESRSLQSMCQDLFHEHLDESYRVLLVAGPVQPAAKSPGVEWSFVLS